MERSSVRLADGSEVFLASRWDRFGARVLDGFIVGGVPLLTFCGSGGLAAAARDEGEVATSSSGEVVLAIGMLVLLATLLVQAVLLARDGQTLAKRLMRQKIVRRDGTPVGTARLLLLRYLVPWTLASVPGLGALFSIVDALMIFGDDRRCLHDHMADTIVVDLKTARAASLEHVAETFA